MKTTTDVIGTPVSFGARLRRACSVSRNVRHLFIRPAGNLASVDGLRAISILMVIMCHSAIYLSVFVTPETFRAGAAGWSLPLNGTLGVDVFFVISGFLIGSMLLLEEKRSGTIRMGRFYARRALRLLPAYYLVMIVWALSVRLNVEHIWENLLYINNLTSARTRFMNWSWSLAVEEQFYLVCPLLLLLVFRNVRHPQSKLRLLISALAAALVLHAWIASRHSWSLPYPLSPFGSDTDRWYELMGLHYSRTSMRFGELLCGVTVAYLNLYEDLDSLICRMGRWAAFVAVTAVGGVVACVALPVSDPNRQWKSWESFAYFAFYHDAFAVFVAILLALSLSSNPAVALLKRVLSFPVWYPIAQLSYSAYLLNPIVTLPLYQSIYFPGEPFGRQLFVLPDWREHWFLVAGLTLLAASLIYVLVERPFMELRARDKVASRVQAEG